jgi:hypothetical protein
MVYLHGLIKADNFSQITVLNFPPDVPTPESRVICDVLANSASGRIDVGSDGVKYYPNPTETTGWVSLAGVRYAISSDGYLPLQKNVAWTNFVCPDCAAGQYRKSGDIVYLRGLVRTAFQWVDERTIAVLPLGSRPSNDLIFSATGNLNTAIRIDVGKNGEVRWVSGGAGTDWISLDTIAFSTSDGGWINPTLNSSWTNYLPLQQETQVRKVKNIVSLRGFLKSTDTFVDDPFSLLFILPMDMKPAKRIVLTTIGYSDPLGYNYAARVDISADGKVEYLFPPQNQTSYWISLDGISFEAL